MLRPAAFLGCDIAHMHEICSVKDVRMGRYMLVSGSASIGICGQIISKGWRNAKIGDSTKGIAFTSPKNSEPRLTQPDRPFEHRLEHRGEVARRGVDDLQDFGQSSLFGQSFVPLGECPVEAALQLSNGAPKFGYVVIQHRGHVLAPVAPRCSGMIRRSAAVSRPD